MKEIITDEWIAYKSGFLGAKQELSENIYFGEADIFERETLGEETWFSRGYEDCYQYFEKKSVEEPITTDMLCNSEEIAKIMKECFTKRVSQINQKEGTAIPAVVVRTEVHKGRR